MSFKISQEAINNLVTLAKAIPKGDYDNHIIYLEDYMCKWKRYIVFLTKELPILIGSSAWIRLSEYLLCLLVIEQHIQKTKYLEGNSNRTEVSESEEEDLIQGYLEVFHNINNNK